MKLSLCTSYNLNLTIVLYLFVISSIITNHQPIQPNIVDLFWIQIEDFVQLINRIYIITDQLPLSNNMNLSTNTNGLIPPTVNNMKSTENVYTMKRITGRWIPNDSINNSIGPAIPLPIDPIITTSLSMKSKSYSPPNKDILLHTNSTNKQLTSSIKQTPAPLQSNHNEDDNLLVNVNFLKNPTYAFTVTDWHANIIISMYQTDRRWTIPRLDSNLPRNLFIPENLLNRTERLKTCMNYEYGIGFLVVRVSSKVKLAVDESNSLIENKEGVPDSKGISVASVPDSVTIPDITIQSIKRMKFQLNQIYGSCDLVEFSNNVSGEIKLLRGKYVIVPFTHVPILFKGEEFALNIQYRSDQVVFDAIETTMKVHTHEATGLILHDIPPAVKSDQQGNDTTMESKDHLLKESKLNNHKNDIATNNINDNDNSMNDDNVEGQEFLEGSHPIIPPSLGSVRTWEFTEYSEEVGIVSMFEEVGELANYLQTLRKEMKSLDKVVESLTTAASTMKNK